jgi:hypothetical protein
MLAFADLIVMAVIMIAISLLSYSLRPKPKYENARPSGIGDFRVPTATEGRVVPLLWGRARIDGANVVWYGDVYQQAIRKKVPGDSSNPFSGDNDYVTIGFKNHVAYQQGLCRGPDVALRGAWIDDKSVFTGNLTTATTFDIIRPDLFGGNEMGNGGFVATVEFYPGNAGQPISNFLDTVGRQRIAAPSSTAPRYTGTCHIVVRNQGSVGASGAYIGNSTTVPILAVDVERFPALFPGQTGTQNKIGTNGDANPINVIYEILTNTEWGLGRAPADIDTGAGSSFLTASNTMIAEENGFSMVLDNAVIAAELFSELERQIGGMIYRDLDTGKWRVKLTRADYTLGTQPLIDESNSELINYTRSGWEDTTNQVQVLFNKRDDDYKESYAIAQDLANAMIQGDGTVLGNQIVSSQVKFPGVKTGDLAAQLAWRELRTLSYPLSRLELYANRSLYNIGLNSVFRYSNAAYGLSEVPMRILSIDYGTLQENRIKVSCVQDVFYFAAPSFGVPGPTEWVPPTFVPAAYSAAEQVIIECPRGLLFRDPVQGGYGQPSWWDDTIWISSGGTFGSIVPLIDYIGNTVWVGSQRKTNEQGYRCLQGTTRLVDNDQFIETGTLVSNMAAQQVNPVASVQIYASASVADFFGTIDSTQLGLSLDQLILIDDEFMLVESASYDSGTGILTLSNVYRGALDSAQRSHSAATTVKFIFTGGDIARFTTTGNPPYYIRNTSVTGNSDSISLRMFAGETAFTGAVTSVTISRTGRRMFRPYPPSASYYNSSTTYFNTPSLEGAGSGLNGFRVDVNWARRDYTTTNEVASLLVDEVPTVSTEYRVEVRADPSGANTLVGSVSAWATGTGPVQVTRNNILMAAAAGTQLRFIIEARHTDPDISTLLESKYTFQHDVTPTSSLTGQFRLNTGTSGLAANVASASYTAAATGTFTVNIGAAQSTANIQVSLNAGAWATVVAAGATTGTFSATSGDGIRLRRTVNEAPNPQFVELRNPSSTAVAYGVFNN